MNEKIFRSSFLTSILVLVVSFVLIFGILLEYYEGRLVAELMDEASYISVAVKSEGAGFINNFKDRDKRITMLDKDGKVLADTAPDGEHYMRCEEFREAQKNGEGMASRYSGTFTEKVTHYAIKLKDGSLLRISTTQNSALTILLGLMQPLIVIFVIIMAISFYLSYKLSKTIVKPINELDLEHPSNNEVYEELTPLLRKISAQKNTIDRQIKEARQKQEEFRLIAENMNEGLIVIDSEGRVLTCNNAALRLLEEENVKPETVGSFGKHKEFHQVAELGLEGLRSEMDMDNGEKMYRLIANPVVDGKKTIGAVVMIIDVTESVKREQLRREFTSNVSHELKTPLTSISGFAEMMRMGDTPDETVRDFSGSIYDETQRLITLVTDIIRISELDEGNIIEENEWVNLYELAEDVLKRLKIVADKRNIRFRLLGEQARIKGAKKILEEMIYNLCDNGIKYNKDGGLLEVVVSNCDNGKVYFSVKDTGIGIPVSEQSRVFERFYRVDKSHSKQLGGTGLGLSIVKHGAAYHNAEIILESTLGEGTRITLEF